jgi:hypothetical protein
MKDYFPADHPIVEYFDVLFDIKQCMKDPPIVRYSNAIVRYFDEK